MPEDKRVIVEKDLIDLERKIFLFRNGQINDEKFRSLRLARGVYGQRQHGVQMVRIKIPFGRLSTKQLRKISDISDEYSNGNLHLTTRQDIQIHHVSLDRTPELWAKLEQDDITLREACGNTVRNVTASAESGIDPKEPFDVSDYAYSVFNYFLRQPFCQELGRKVKIAFSNSDEDTAYTFIHDIGFIPKLDEDGNKGFKILLGGGLGAQPFLAQVAYDFLPADDILTFVESVLRVFDRHGERTSRHKARLKYLIQKLGIEAFLELIDEEKKAIIPVSVAAYFSEFKRVSEIKVFETPATLLNEKLYTEWIATNTFAQKQEGLFGVYIKVLLGNIHSDNARALADIIDTFADSNDLRITVNQNFILKNVHQSVLPHLFNALHAFATYSVSYKPVGVNIGGLPTASGEVLIDLARVKPETVSHFEFGVKTQPSANSVLNIVLHNTDIKDYQTQVQTPEPGVNRGYLANAEKVRVLGFEIDGSIKLNHHITFNGAFAYTDGKYLTFTNAPVPIEEVGGPQAFKDISGGQLPGISKYAGSLGTDLNTKGTFLGLKGSYFGGIDVYYRSTFSSSPSPSAFLDIEGYALLNARAGFRASNGISFFVWGRNLSNKDYYEQLLVAPGSAGQIGGVLGDPRTYGLTLRYTL